MTYSLSFVITGISPVHLLTYIKVAVQSLIFSLLSTWRLFRNMMRVVEIRTRNIIVNIVTLQTSNTLFH